MPYIKEEDRQRILAEFGNAEIFNAGELNFLITRILNDYLEAHTTSYAIFNEVIGVLECAKLELYRRKLAAYEDRKIAENGDVY